MVTGRTGIIVGLIVLCCSVALAQTPTPTPLPPGTPLKLTCLDFSDGPGVGGVLVQENWLYLDRACVLLENNTGGAIEIAHVLVYFGQVTNLLGVQVRIWEVLNESLLPDLPAAAQEVTGGLLPFYETLGPTFPDIVYARLSLGGSGSSLPVINPGKKFVVDIINLLDDGTIPGMKVTSETVADCPGSFTPGTNIFGDWDGSVLTWNFKEDIGESETNFFIGVEYYPDATPRTPAMGPIGIVGIMCILSYFLVRRKR